MNLYSFKDGVILGTMAMTGVFVVLAAIGLILYSFELVFYKKEKAQESHETIITEKGIPKKVVAVIAATIAYEYTENEESTGSQSETKFSSIKIKRHKKMNKTYEKLKLERWKNE